MPVERGQQLPPVVARETGFWAKKVRGKIMPDTVFVGDHPQGGGFLVLVTSYTPDRRTTTTRDATASTAGAAISAFNERPDMRASGFTVALRIDPDGNPVEGSYCIVDLKPNLRRTTQ